MPNTTVPAAAEGMPRITERHIDQSYDLMALLDVTAFAVSLLDQAGDAIEGRIRGNIGVCLEMAQRFASDLHDVLVLAEEHRS